jgi:DNA-binding NarL/FixJ family response regulator
LTLGRAIAADLAASPLVLRIDELAHRARLQLDTALSQSGEQAADPWRVDYALTPRERDVLALLARGRSNGEIGRELFISTKTASVHVSSILRKLGVSNRVEAAAIAVQRSPG